MFLRSITKRTSPLPLKDPQTIKLSGCLTVCWQYLGSKGSLPALRYTYAPRLHVTLNVASSLHKTSSHCSSAHVEYFFANAILRPFCMRVRSGFLHGRWLRYPSSLNRLLTVRTLTPDSTTWLFSFIFLAVERGLASISRLIMLSALCDVFFWPMATLFVCWCIDTATLHKPCKPKMYLALAYAGHVADILYFVACGLKCYYHSNCLLG